MAPLPRTAAMELISMFPLAMDKEDLTLFGEIVSMRAELIELARSMRSA